MQVELSHCIWCVHELRDRCHRIKTHILFLESAPNKVRKVTQGSDTTVTSWILWLHLDDASVASTTRIPQNKPEEDSVDSNHRLGEYSRRQRDVKTHCLEWHIVAGVLFKGCSSCVVLVVRTGSVLRLAHGLLYSWPSLQGSRGTHSISRLREDCPIYPQAYGVAIACKSIQFTS